MRNSLPWRSVWALALALMLPFSAFSADEIKEGVNYKKIAAKVPTDSGEKAEVVELFWYGCPHCYSMEKPIANWLKSKPENVVFRRVPAVFNPSWEYHARVFYTAEALGVLDKIHTPLFENIHELNKKMDTDQAVEALFKEHGVGAKDFKDAWDSFLVNTKVKQAKELTRRYGISSVPSLIVNGQYLTDNGMNGGPGKTLDVVNFLVKN